MSFLNVTINTDHVVESLPPYIQWFRGTLKANDPAPLKKGCWELEATAWEHIVDDKSKEYLFPHGNDEIKGYGYSALSFAVLAWRIDYQVVDRLSGQYTYLPPNEYQEGATMKLRVYAYVKEVSEFAILTLSRGNGYAFRDILTKEFKTKVIAPATTLAGKLFPQYAFWMEVDAAPKKSYSQGSYSTPPKMINPTGKPEKYLEDLFVGEDVLALCATRYDKASEWSKETFTSKEEATTTTTTNTTSNLVPQIGDHNQGLDDVSLEDVFNVDG